VRVDTRLKGPWFDGERFSLVDAVFGPVFRYFDAFDHIGKFGLLIGLPKIAAWRAALAARPSVQRAVSPEYPALLWEFYRTRSSHLSRLMEAKKLAA
jgi:glutathione S-transferase